MLKGLCGRRGLRERRQHRGLRLRRRRDRQRQRTGRGAEAREAGGRVLTGRLELRRVQEWHFVHRDWAQVLPQAQCAPSDSDGPEFRYRSSVARGGERRGTNLAALGMAGVNECVRVRIGGCERGQDVGGGARVALAGAQVRRLPAAAELELEPRACRCRTRVRLQRPLKLSPARWVRCPVASLRALRHIQLELQRCLVLEHYMS